MKCSPREHMYVGCCYAVEPAASCLVVSPPLFGRPGTGEGRGEKVGQMNQGSQSDEVLVLQHASHIYNGC